MKYTTSFFLLPSYLPVVAIAPATRVKFKPTRAPFVFAPNNKWDGNDGSWSTFSINVGTPGQDFRVLISTAGYETWVVMPEGCTSMDPSNCANTRGAEVFNSAASPGFRTNRSSTWDMIGLYDLNTEQHLGHSGNGLFGYDRVGLGTYAQTGGLSLNRTVVAGIADKDYFLGQLGLSTRPISFESTSDPIPSLFTQLKDQNLIPSSSYGYTVGAPYRHKKVPGSLVLGGYDQSRFESPNTTFAFSSDPARDLTVGVQSIVAQNTFLGVAALATTGHLSFIDTTVPHIWLPREVCDVFERALSLTYDPTTDLYLVKDTVRARLQTLNPTITFKLGNQARVDPSGGSVTIDLPYAAFDLQASYPLFNTTTNYFPIRRAANDSQYILGRTFFQEAYLIVDNERRNFAVAQAVFPNPMPGPDIVTIPCSDCTIVSAASNSHSTGAITGIAVSAALLIILVIVGISSWLRGRKRARHLPEPLALGVRQGSDYRLASEKRGGLVHESLLSPQLSELPTPVSEMPGAGIVHELPVEYHVLIPSPVIGAGKEDSWIDSPATAVHGRRSPRWIEIAEEETRNE